jgi:hypothetical protein
MNEKFLLITHPVNTKAGRRGAIVSINFCIQSTYWDIKILERDNFSILMDLKTLMYIFWWGRGEGSLSKTLDFITQISNSPKLKKKKKKKN